MPRSPRRTEPAADYDGAWKEALARYLPSMAKLYFPAEHAGIDWSRGFTFLDQELRRVLARLRPRQNRGQRRADRLARVFTREGEEEWLLLHIEVQSAQDSTLPARIHDMFCLLRAAYPSVKVVPMVILADSSPNWNPHTHVESWAGLKIRFTFPTCKLARLKRKFARDPSAAALIALAQLRAHETAGSPVARLEAKWEIVRKLYFRNARKADVVAAFEVVDWMMQLPERENLQFEARIVAFEKQSAMPYVTSIERIGIKRGRQEGRQEGQAETALALLGRLLGKLPVQIQGQIRGLTVSQLEKLTLALLDLGSIADLNEWLRKNG